MRRVVGIILFNVLIAGGFETCGGERIKAQKRIEIIVGRVAVYQLVIWISATYIRAPRQLRDLVNTYEIPTA